MVLWFLLVPAVCLTAGVLLGHREARWDEFINDAAEDALDDAS